MVSRITQFFCRKLTAAVNFLDNTIRIRQRRIRTVFPLAPKCLRLVLSRKHIKLRRIDIPLFFCLPIRKRLPVFSNIRLTLLPLFFLFVKSLFERTRIINAFFQLVTKRRHIFISHRRRFVRVIQSQIQNTGFKIIIPILLLLRSFQKRRIVNFRHGACQKLIPFVTSRTRQHILAARQHRSQTLLTEIIIFLFTHFLHIAPVGS